eukprot:COSAG03_NODE_615_length_6697_cov_23.571688_3_plen_709_part_00
MNVQMSQMSAPAHRHPRAGSVLAPRRPGGVRATQQRAAAGGYPWRCSSLPARFWPPPMRWEGDTKSTPSAVHRHSALVPEPMDDQGLLATSGKQNLMPAPAAIEWPALDAAEKASRWCRRISAIVAIAALGAGTWFGPWGAGWNFLASFAAVGIGSWLLVRRTRSYVCFKTFFSVHLDYRGVRSKARKMAAAGTADPVALKALWDEAHERSAAKGYECVARLQGLWVKMAQMLATRSDILPECYCRLLGKAQDEMPACGIAEVRAMLEAELGRRVSDVFEDLEENPIGCASIAQVHRARLKAEGTQVVVKLQHAGIEDRMAADILILKQLLVWLKRLEPDFDMTAIARQWMAAIPEELDFQRESSNMAEMRKYLEQGSPDPAPGARGAHATDPQWASVEAIIPEVFDDLSTRRVLVQRYEPGAALNAIDKVAEQLRANEGLNEGQPSTEGQLQLLTSIARWFGRGLFLDGVFHADPHPGNFLLSARSKTSTGAGMPVLLDFGLIKHLQKPVQLGLARLVLGCNHLMGALADGATMQTQETQDRAQAAQQVVLEGFKDLGFPISDDNTRLMLDVAVFLFRPSQTAEEAEAERVEAEMKAMDKVTATANDKEMKKLGPTPEEEQQNKIALTPLTALPEELILFQRVLTLFRGLCTKHSVKIAFIEQLAPFAVSACILMPLRSCSDLLQAISVCVHSVILHVKLVPSLLRL